MLLMVLSAATSGRSFGSLCANSLDALFDASRMQANHLVNNVSRVIDINANRCTWMVKCDEIIIYDTVSLHSYRIG